MLHTPPRVRKHVSDQILQAIGRTVEGGWVGVVLAEEADDEYLVVGARPLDRDETDAASDVVEGVL